MSVGNGGCCRTSMGSLFTRGTSDEIPRIERHRPDERARLVETVVAILRIRDQVSLRELAGAAGNIPERIAERLLKRLAFRGLVCYLSHGCWTATSALRVEPLLRPVAV